MSTCIACIIPAPEISQRFPHHLCHLPWFRIMTRDPAVFGSEIGWPAACAASPGSFFVHQQLCILHDHSAHNELRCWVLWLSFWLSNFRRAQPWSKGFSCQQHSKSGFLEVLLLNLESYFQNIGLYVTKLSAGNPDISDVVHKLSLNPTSPANQQIWTH